MSERRRGTVESSRNSYRLGGCGGVEAVARGTNVLVSGPSIAGTDEVALDLLAVGLREGERAVVVTADEGAERVLSGLEERGSAAGSVHVVDCSGASARGSFDDTDRVKYVPSPEDLTGVGIGIAKCTQSIGDAATRGVRVGVLSLTTLLQYADLDRVFDFVHVLTGRISAAGYLGVFVIDPGAHDDETANTIRAQFDGVLSVEDGEDGRRIRAVGLSGG